jgi:hypothetical protein
MLSLAISTSSTSEGKSLILSRRIANATRIELEYYANAFMQTRLALMSSSTFITLGQSIFTSLNDGDAQKVRPPANSSLRESDQLGIWDQLTLLGAEAALRKLRLTKIDFSALQLRYFVASEKTYRPLSTLLLLSMQVDWTKLRSLRGCNLTLKEAKALVLRCPLLNELALSVDRSNLVYLVAALQPLHLTSLEFWLGWDARRERLFVTRSAAIDKLVRLAWEYLSLDVNHTPWSVWTGCVPAVPRSPITADFCSKALADEVHRELQQYEYWHEPLYDD